MRCERNDVEVLHVFGGVADDATAPPAVQVRVEVDVGHLLVIAARDEADDTDVL